MVTIEAFSAVACAGADGLVHLSDQEDTPEGRPLSPDSSNRKKMLKQSSMSSTKSSGGSWTSLSLPSASRARRNWQRAMQVLHCILPTYPQTPVFLQFFLQLACRSSCAPCNVGSASCRLMSSRRLSGFSGLAESLQPWRSCCKS